MNKQVRRQDPIRFAPGSGNVFEDLNLPEPADLLAKARLAEAIAGTIETRGLTQREAGELLGVDQGSVSKLINGRLDGFSQERLIRYLTALGNRVEIVVHPPGADHAPGRVTVRTA